MTDLLSMTQITALLREQADGRAPENDERTILKEAAQRIDREAVRDQTPAMPAMGTEEALGLAAEALKKVCAETDTASPEGWQARTALAMIEVLLEQHGCRHFDPAVSDGKLTTLCDVVVFG